MKYTLINPNTGKPIDNYEIYIDGNNVKIFLFGRRGIEEKQITVKTDNNGKSYYVVTFNGCTYLLSNLIFASVHKREIKSDFIIHHIDFDLFNNRPENLVEVTLKEDKMIRDLYEYRMSDIHSFNKVMKYVQLAEKSIKIY